MCTNPICTVTHISPGIQEGNWNPVCDPGTLTFTFSSTASRKSLPELIKIQAFPRAVPFGSFFFSVSLPPSFAWRWAWEQAEDVGHGRGSEMLVPFLWIHITEPNLGPLTRAQQSQSTDTRLWWKWKLLSCVPMDCSPPGSSVYGILQARILEWVAIPYSRESSQPRDRTQWSRLPPSSTPSSGDRTQGSNPALQADSLLSAPPGKPQESIASTKQGEQGS